MRRIPLWVEPYAGSLAVGLRLMGAPRPLVGWMGSKGAYHAAITSILQVSAADEVWCADVSDWANVWRALAKPGIARAAADIIDEIEADALSSGDSPASHRRVWMALREEWREAGTTVDARGVARWVALVKGSSLSAGPRFGSKLTQTERSQNVHFGSESLRHIPSPLPVRVWGCASQIPTRRDAVVMLDPPYDGTRAYRGPKQHTQTEALVERDRWRAAGATVAMCEQVPTGGIAYDIAGRRFGPGRNHGGKPATTGEVLSVFWPRMAGGTLFDQPVAAGIPKQVEVTGQNGAPVQTETRIVIVSGSAAEAELDRLADEEEG